MDIVNGKFEIETSFAMCAIGSRNKSKNNTGAAFGIVYIIPGIDNLTFGAIFKRAN